MSFARSEVRRLIEQEDAVLAELGIEPDDSGDSVVPVDVAFLMIEDEFNGRVGATFGRGGCFPINTDYLDNGSREL